MEKLDKCGTCSQYIGGGDFGLCCKVRYDLCYETSDACEKFDPIECACCGESGGVTLSKYMQAMAYRGKQISIERWTYRCSKCGRAFEPGWMTQQNLGRMNFAYEIRRAEDGDVC